MDRIETHADALQAVESFDFDCFDMSDTLGRKDAFVMIVYKLMKNLDSFTPPTVTLNYDKLILFLQAIQGGYRQDVPYHNDLHGADVA